MTVVAALYVDERGHYMAMPGVDAWGESRDARRYRGPWPIVAHPPCADWSRLRGMTKHVPGRRELAPMAVWQVRACGGVLEHPAYSALWDELALPVPGGLPDVWGGWSVRVDQVAWGHAASKPTWLYLVGVDRERVVLRTGGQATHVIGSSRKKHEGRELAECSAAMRRRTPTEFAVWLVDLARSTRPDDEIEVSA